MKKVTSIVIGAGLRGGHVYSQYALDHPDEFQVVAVAEPDKERRESFAKRHNIPEELCFESYEELLGKEKLADCAMICTMDRMHYEPTIMALKKEYHVLCEKPMSPDKKEIIEMGEMAKKYDRILSVCHVLRYSPFFSKLKELLEEIERAGREKNKQPQISLNWAQAVLRVEYQELPEGMIRETKVVMEDANEGEREIIGNREKHRKCVGSRAKE